MDCDEYRTGTLALVRGVSDAVGRYLDGDAELAETVSWVISASARLRQIARDDKSQHLVGLIDRSAARLQTRLETDTQSSGPIDDSDSSEIVLVKALWELEVHLARLSLVH